MKSSLIKSWLKRSSLLSFNLSEYPCCTFFFYIIPFLIFFFWLCVEEKNWIAGNRPGWPSGGITPHKPVWAMAGNDGTTCNGGVFSRPWITKAGDDNGRWPVWFCARIVDGRIPLSQLNSSKSPPPCIYISSILLSASVPWPFIGTQASNLCPATPITLFCYSSCL